MSKKILIIGALFLTLFLINIISADDWCVVAANSADCETTLSGKVVMSISSSTNAHGSLAGQGVFAPVLCCNFGEGDTTCSVDNKVLGLSSSTNAHAEAPDITPNYNNDVCYDSLKDCRETTDSCSVAMNEIEVVYISSSETQPYTNAHIEEAGLGSQNYDSKICCVVEYPKICDLTSAEWEYEEVMEGADVEAIVNGTECGGIEISFEVFRGSTSCDDITGCENPANVVFGAGSSSVSGTWNASPAHEDEYSFVATVVSNPDESISSSAPDLLVNEPICDSILICSQYEGESACNSNVCGIDVQSSVPGVDCDDPEITCECVWDDDECKGSWDGGDGYCGDESIDSGEQCDGSEWGNITGCDNFDDFTGGTLSCYDDGTSNECHFDTTNCTGGGGGYCGDGVVGAGETCDDDDWGDITGCDNFDDFTGGTLSCYAPGTENGCQFDTTQCTGGTSGTCGDGEVNTGEQCDGDDWGDITGCDNFDEFTDGTLSCDQNNCLFDTSQCIGGSGGYCTDGTIDAGETCDSDDWGPINGCSDFDMFTGGTLVCGTDCQFDTSDCVGPGTGADVGTCIYTQYTDDTCDDDGFLTFEWTTEWIWDAGCDATCQSQPENLALKTKCDDDNGLTDSLACPAQIPLPFFNIYSFIVTLVIIALIYTVIILSKKKKLRFV